MEFQQYRALMEEQRMLTAEFRAHAIGNYQRKVMKTQAKGEGKTQEWRVSSVPRPPHAHVHQRSLDSGVWWRAHAHGTPKVPRLACE
ncbi:hypothetical protein PIB30_037703 [Stylosanthes scabra]|uniref:Uncharacterized protein n=1 Tax=Stylosanthes scabra TaxID=79078 RepID=A0ABU6YCK9_9FABA|nr:hypothetical protein [Stylosanthes scabra]